METIFKREVYRQEGMADQIPYTEKQLKEWAGWRAFRDGKALFEQTR